MLISNVFHPTGIVMLQLAQEVNEVVTFPGFETD